VLYRSPEIDFGDYNEVNVSFAYNMYGSTMGTLHIKENTTGSWMDVWNESGDKGTSWFTKNQNITGLTGTGNIAIWMDCGGSYTSDAAVDSVNITGITGGIVEEFGYISGVGWQVNVTVPSGTGYEDLFLNATYDGKTRNDTQTNAINYGSTDSCTYTSGNWVVNCSDNCDITSDVDIGSNTLILDGIGYFYVNANITSGGVDFGDSDICQMVISDGDQFII